MIESKVATKVWSIPTLYWAGRRFTSVAILDLILQLKKGGLNNY